MSNAFLNSERPLHSLTKKDFDQLKKSGMFELYLETNKYGNFYNKRRDKIKSSR